MKVQYTTDTQPTNTSHPSRFKPFVVLKRRVRRTLFNLGFTGPLLRRVTKRLRLFSKPDAPYDMTLLALKPERFRGDLQILGDHYGFRILALEKGWQRKLLELYWDDRTVMGNYYVPKPGSHTERVRRRLQAFLRRFLPLFFEKVGIDAVIGAATYYLDDLDIGKVASELGVPYIVLYRECFLADERELRIQREMAKDMGTFEGDRILVHNTILRDLLLDTGYAPAGTVAAPGCLRMDGYLQRIKTLPRPHRPEPKLATLFSFVHCIGINDICTTFTPDRDAGFVELFDHTHAMFAKTALENPDMRFVIKPKYGADIWMENIELALAKYGLDAEKIPNLEILPRADAQQLIIDSRVVVAFASTTLAESAVAGKVVVIPHFAECLLPENHDNIMLEDEFHCFRVARSPEELGSMILEGMDDAAEVSEETMAARRAMFERYVSPMAGTATQDTAQTLRDTVQAAKRHGGRP